jgi:hypothetical protein
VRTQPEDFWHRFAEIRHRLERTWATTKAAMAKSEALLADGHRHVERTGRIDVDVKSFTVRNRSARAD